MMAFIEFENSAKIRLCLLAIFWISLVITLLYLSHRDIWRYQNQSWGETMIKVTDVRACLASSRSGRRTYICEIEADADFGHNDQFYHYMFSFGELEAPPKARADSMLPARFYVDGDQIVVDFPGRYLKIRILLGILCILLPFYTGFRAYQFKKEWLL